MLDCTDLSNELDCVVGLFATYLQSQCLGMQSLVLRAILGLTERADTVSGGSWQHHERGGPWHGLGQPRGCGRASGSSAPFRCCRPAPRPLLSPGLCRAALPASTTLSCGKPEGRLLWETLFAHIAATALTKGTFLFPQARQMLVLLPCVMKLLQHTDSNASAMALPVLSTMLRLLEGRTLSLTALELADKLLPLFDNVRLVGSPAHRDTGHMRDPGGPMSTAL